MNFVSVMWWLLLTKMCLYIMHTPTQRKQKIMPLLLSSAFLNTFMANHKSIVNWNYMKLINLPHIWLCGWKFCIVTANKQAKFHKCLKNKFKDFESESKHKFNLKEHAQAWKTFKQARKVAELWKFTLFTFCGRKNETQVVSSPKYVKV